MDKKIYRKEYKYVLAERQFKRLEPQLAALLKRDIHCGENGYTIRSLYFDSLYDRDLFKNVDGLLEKSKLRLRAYLPDPKTFSFECKTKFSGEGTKYSLKLTKEEAMQTAKGNFYYLCSSKDPLAQQFYLKLSAGGYIPRTIVEYDRIAYQYPVSDVRITFDTNIRATASPFGFFDDNPIFFDLTKKGIGVLEIKFNDFLPSPIRRIMNKINSSTRANSKYAMARSLIG